MAKNKTFSLLFGLILGISVFFQGLYLEGTKFISYHYLFMMLISILFIVYSFVSGINLKPTSLLDWFVIITVPVYIVASITAVSVWDSISCVFRYVACYLLYFLSKDLLKNNSKLFFKALFYCGSLASVYGIYLGITGSAFDSKKGLLLSIFHYHNASAVFFACIVLMGIYLSGKSCLAEKLIICALNAVLVSNIVYSQSRGGWLVFGIAVIVYILSNLKSDNFREYVISVVAPFAGVIVSINGFMSAFSQRNSDFSCSNPSGCYLFLGLSIIVAIIVNIIFSKTPAKSIITPKIVAIGIPAVIIIALVYLFLFAPEAIKGRISEFSLTSATVGERITFFKDAFSIYIKNPVTGIGGDCWKYMYPAVQSEFYTVAHPHSYLFELMTDAGTFGIIMFLLLIAGYITSIFKYKGEDKLLAKIAAGLILVHSMFDFDTDYFTIVSLLFVLLGIVSSCDNDEKKSSKFFVIIPILLVIWSSLNLISGYYYNQALKASSTSQPITTVYDYSKKSIMYMPISSNYLTSHGNICIGMALNVDRSYLDEAKICFEKSYKLNNKHYETINQLAFYYYYTGQFQNACNTISQLVYNQPFIPTTYSYIYRLYDAVLDYGVKNNNSECIKSACEMMINNYHYAHSVSSENRSRIEMGTDTHIAFNEAKDMLSKLKIYGVE